MICLFELLPKMRERRSGCIINIASRAATVDVPFCVSYNAGKAALTRAVGSIQAELEMDGLGDNIQLYALHPGGVLTAMGESESDPSISTCRCAFIDDDLPVHPPKDVSERYPIVLENKSEYQKLFVDKPELCGATCAYIAAGKAKVLRGLYYDCRQDIERVCGASHTLRARDLNSLTVNFLDGYENEP